MTRNLLYADGLPTDHDFAALGGAVGEALLADGIETEIVSDPQVLADRLTGDNSPELFTVLALRWTMGADRYADRRAEWAYSPDERTRTAIEQFVADGGGLLALHTACICFDDWPGWGDLLGAGWDWGSSSHPPPGPVLVAPTDHQHPITDHLNPFTMSDEVYGFLAERPGLRPLVTASYDERSHPVLWARQHGSGRVVVDTLGHSVESLEHSTHRLLLRRSALWAIGLADEEVRDRACPANHFGAEGEVAP